MTFNEWGSISDLVVALATLVTLGYLAVQVRGNNKLARAEALPEKLVFPLIAGFLPGLLVWTLGPAVHQLVEIVGSITS